LAAANGHFHTVQILVTLGADTESMDNRKLTPLTVAFRRGQEMVRIFVFVCIKKSQLMNLLSSSGHLID
jgi:ankyrin repeat protein